MKLTIPEDKIEKHVLFIRNRHVVLDLDLAHLYGIPAINIKRAVKRYSNSFPANIMFSLNKAELDKHSKQFSTSSIGGMKYAPVAFTAEGVNMLSRLLNNELNPAESSS